MAEKDGLEYPDITPVAVPFGYRRPESLHETITRMIRTEVSRAAQNSELESFEEADDFDVDGDSDLPYSPHEVVEMQEEVPRSEFERLNKSERKDGGRKGVDGERRGEVVSKSSGSVNDRSGEAGGEQEHGSAVAGSGDK